MQEKLQVTLTRTSDEKPLAVLDNMPGWGVELRPHELRAFASALMQAAADCDSQETRSAHFISQKREYGLDSLCVAERRVVRFPDGHLDIKIESYEYNGHAVTIYQDAQLTDGRPSFFVVVGSAVVLGAPAFCIQDAREHGNAVAAKRRKKVDKGSGT